MSHIIRTAVLSIGVILFSPQNVFAHSGVVSHALVPYAVGFLTATALLLIVGLSTGAYLVKPPLVFWRVAGGLTAVGGLLLAIGVV